MSPSEVAFALKLAHMKGNWDAVGLIINEIEQLYGEMKITDLFLPKDHSGTEEPCDCAVCAKDGPLGSFNDTVWLPWGTVVAES